MALKDDFVSQQPGLGFIQKIAAFPFLVTFFTEIGIQLYHTLSKSSTIFCDATGTIVSLKQLGPQKRLLYYGIVISSPKKSGCFRVNHSRSLGIVSVTFLGVIQIRRRDIVWVCKYCHSQAYCHRSKPCVTIKFYNGESLSDYLSRCCNRMLKNNRTHKAEIHNTCLQTSLHDA